VNFADFYQRASTASKFAQKASNAKRLDEFRRLIGQLRAACNGCHEKYMKPIDWAGRSADVP
jgi:cytochrome c556